MNTGRELTYSQTLRVSWSITWRLLLADLVLFLLIALFTVAFGSLRSPVVGVVVWGSYLLLKWLVAWPFVIRRTLAPQFMLPLTGVAPNLDPKSIPIRYWACVALGLVTDLVSFFPVIVILLLLRDAGLLIINSLLLSLLFFIVRFVLILPAGVYLLARRVAHTYKTLP